ncbi:MAG: adenine deaminase [candidate division KSB1 bacterium]|nr:adenine deaminase [candidate division KSB1 bacterium]MDZ7293802.1 adenine deaminase [candidate division KSB1 bacterium]MDZ7391413.1 adenine deaminase [candidate division KSB1 bacterium]MDZ7413924.1 adenine deaminase [candidate division KSB1 bacterium]
MVSLEHIIRAHKGQVPADLLLRNGKVVNVLSGEIYEADVAILGDTILAVGQPYEARQVIDLKGLYVAPGFIDGHIHIESSMVEVPQFARAVVPLGTTSVVADPHEIANVLGYEGIRYMMDASKYNPLNVFFMLPSCIPSTNLESAGSVLRAFDIFPFLREKWVLGLGEMMNFGGVLAGEEDVLDKLKIVEEKRIDGHAPGLTGRDLNTYIALGIRSDHECTTVEEAREKLRLGMHIMIREGTTTRNLRDLLPLVTPENERRCMFVTDDRHPDDILEQGHINYMVKTAIAEGLPPVTAIRLATINTAEYFGLRRLGVIAPGRTADLIAFDDFRHFAIKKVFKNGRLVAEDGKAIYETPLRPPAQVRSSVNIKWLEGGEFVIPARGSKCRVMGVVPHQIVTESLIEDAPIRDGVVVSEPERDLLRCYVVERHRASGNIGKGLVRGFGLRKGALASTIAHDAHNIIVCGVDDRDIARAVIQLNKMGGGLVVVADGEVKESLQLPIAGLMSDRPLEEVSAITRRLNQAARALGSKLTDPFMSMSFLALPVVPKLKLTDRGLVEVESFSFVDLFVDARQ